jgi:hypothetical protein
MRAEGFKFLACLLKKKTSNSKDRSESRIKFLSGFPSLSLVNFLYRIFMAGFWNNFQDHRRLPEQLLE